MNNSLPPNWVEIAEAGQLSYFYNLETEEIVFERPQNEPTTTINSTAIDDISTLINGPSSSPPNREDDDGTTVPLTYVDDGDGNTHATYLMPWQKNKEKNSNDTVKYGKRGERFIDQNQFQSSKEDDSEVSSAHDDGKMKKQSSSSKSDNLSSPWTANSSTVDITAIYYKVFNAVTRYETEDDLSTVQEAYIPYKDLIDINEIHDVQAKSILMVAASNTSKSLKPLMKFLLEECSHIDVNLANKEGETPLMLAIQHCKSPASVMMLAQRTTDVNARRLSGEAAIHLACIREDPFILQALLEGGGKSLDLSLPFPPSTSTSTKSTPSLPSSLTPLQYSFHMPNFDLFSTLLLFSDHIRKNNDRGVDEEYRNVEREKDDEICCPGIAIVKEGIRTRRTSTCMLPSTATCIEDSISPTSIAFSHSPIVSLFTSTVPLSLPSVPSLSCSSIVSPPLTVSNTIDPSLPPALSPPLITTNTSSNTSESESVQKRDYERERECYYYSASGKSHCEDDRDTESMRDRVWDREGERFNLSILRCAPSHSPSDSGSSPMGLMMRHLPDPARRLITTAYRLDSSKVRVKRSKRLGSGGFGTVYAGKLLVRPSVSESSGLQKSEREKERETLSSIAIKTFSLPDEATTTNNKNKNKKRERLNPIDWKEVEQELLLMICLHYGSRGSNTTITDSCSDSHVTRNTRNILQCFGYTRVRDGSRMSLLLEKATYGSLRSLLQRAAVLERETSIGVESEKEGLVVIPLSLTLRWWKEITDTLVYLHEECHIKHKDIKCDNLLVFDDDKDNERERQRFTLKICDFGIAKEHVTHKSRTNQTNGGSSYVQAGTLAYMAFEVRNGESSVYASDIFAVCMSVVEIVTRRTPMVQKSRDQVLEAVRVLFERREREREILHDSEREREQGLKKEVERLLLRCIKYDSEDETGYYGRPTARELSREIGKIIDKYGLIVQEREIELLKDVLGVSETGEREDGERVEESEDDDEDHEDDDDSDSDRRSSRSNNSNNMSNRSTTPVVRPWDMDDSMNSHFCATSDLPYMRQQRYGGFGNNMNRRGRFGMF